MLFGPVLKEIQAPQGIPTLDGEHSHKAGNIHIGQGFPKIWWGTTIHARKYEFTGHLRARHGGSEVAWLLMWHLCPLQTWSCAGLSCVIASALGN